MNKFLAIALSTLAAVFSSQAAEVKISNVHLCCQACVRGVEKALAGVKGVTTAVDKDAETVTLKSEDKANLQKAADALVAAGYFGKSSDAAVKLAPDSAATGQKVSKAKVEGVHLCCGQCVSAVDKAVKAVPGVKAHTAVKNSESFEVTGDFNDRELIQALQQAGLSGRIAK